jgi:hypothetical protein
VVAFASGLRHGSNHATPEPIDAPVCTSTSALCLLEILGEARREKTVRFLSDGLIQWLAAHGGSQLLAQFIVGIQTRIDAATGRSVSRKE